MALRATKGYENRYGAATVRERSIRRFFTGAVNEGATFNGAVIAQTASVRG
jgi:hypothetical protein